MPNLKIFLTSTREQRKGAAVAAWFVNQAQGHGGFQVELVDLLELDLPLLDEPKHPRLQQYQHEHTRRFSALVAGGDAYVFVIPEYNTGTSPALLNALDYVYREWNYKPAGFVSYGGVSGGTRSAQMVKPVLTTLKMMPIPEAVSIPFFARHMREDGRFDPGEVQEKAAAGMLGELLRWSEALAPLRR
jgi:NAD(P)H-dependent FMN reductase